MPHAVFTIVTPVRPDRLTALDAVLGEIQRDQVANPHLRFGEFDGLHFAAFVIFERATPRPLLVFENNVDGSRKAHLANLVRLAEPGLDAVYENCEGYPGRAAAPEAKREYLQRNVRTPNLYHIGTPYRPARHICEDRDLRDKLDLVLDRMPAGPLDARLRALPRVPFQPLPRQRIRNRLQWLAGWAAAWLGAHWIWPGRTLPSALIPMLFAIHMIWLAYRDHQKSIAERLAFGQTGAPGFIWQLLKQHVPVKAHSEARLWERVMNWSWWLMVASGLWAVIFALWDQPIRLTGFLVALFTGKALWLLVLVGWPSSGSAPFAIRDLAKTLGLVALAVGAGLLVGRITTALAGPAVAHCLQSVVWIALLIGWLVLAQRALGRVADALWLWQFGGAAATLGFLVSRVSPVCALDALAVGGLVAWPLAGRWPDGEFRDELTRGGFLLAALTIGGLLRLPLDPASIPPLWSSAVIAVLTLAGLFALWVVPLPSPDVPGATLDHASLLTLLDLEDRQVQNHMSAIVRVKKGWFRAPVLATFLWTLNRAFFRSWLPDMERGKLFGVPTVHFAQWVLLDDTRYLFLSNYDHNWSLYLDDFGTHIATGIQKIWGQGDGNPGVTDLGRFKDYARSVMVPHAVWYSAYENLTVRQIWNNQQIRRGMVRTTKPLTSITLLKRFAQAPRISSARTK